MNLRVVYLPGPRTWDNLQDIHVILAIADNSTPPLTRYRRAIVEVQP